MARRAFFSFHYQGDIWRVSQIRNCWLTQDRETAGFWDAAAWENVKRGGDSAIRRWIDNQLAGTSVTVVLIGSQTAERRYVKYEIEKSYELGKGLLGVWVHNMRDQLGQTAIQGRNPFEDFYIDDQWGQRSYFSQLYPTYDWVYGNGYQYFASWVESAARAAGR